MQIFKKIALLVLIAINISNVSANNDEFRPLTHDIGEVAGLTYDEVESFNKNLDVLNQATAIMLLKLQAIDVSPEQRAVIIEEFISSIPKTLREVLRKIGYFEFEIFEDEN